MSLKRLNDGFRYTDRGAMRDQITIMQPNPGRTADGSPGDPILFGDGIWAKIIAQRQMEKDTSELVQGQSFYKVVTPYMSGVTSQMTVISPSGRTWFIVSVNDPDQRQVELWFLCREINDGIQDQAGDITPLVTLSQPIPDIDGGSINPGDPDYTS